jgi:hypothetical protein
MSQSRFTIDNCIPPAFPAPNSESFVQSVIQITREPAPDPFS